MKNTAWALLLIASVGCKTSQRQENSAVAGQRNAEVGSETSDDLDEIARELGYAKTLLAQQPEGDLQLTEPAAPRTSAAKIQKLKERIKDLERKVSLAESKGTLKNSAAAHRVSVQVIDAKLVMQRNPAAAYGYTMPLAIAVNDTFAYKAEKPGSTYGTPTGSWPTFILEAGSPPKLATPGATGASVAKSSISPLWKSTDCFLFSAMIRGFGALEAVHFEKFICKNDFKRPTPNDPEMLTFTMVSDYESAFYDIFALPTSKGSYLEVRCILDPK